LGSYLIYRGTSRSNLVQIATALPSTTVYHDRTLNPVSTYYYGVKAVEQGLESPMSPVAGATTLPLPNAPTSVGATAVSSTRISLTWQENLSPRGLPIANYQIYRGTSAGALSKVATVKTTTYSSGSLAHNTTYYFQIVAVDTSYNSSAPSQEVWAKTMR
jgi:titin